MTDFVLREHSPPDSTIGRPHDYLHEAHTLRSWLFTTDHKRIGILYLISITLFFIIGAVAAGLIRLALVVPDGQIFTNDTYNKLFTIHGVVMVWFFLIPSIPATLGNFLLPIMIGAKDLAFPKLNLLSWYIFMSGSLFALFSVVIGGVDTGWTFYAPFSTTFSNTYVIPALLGVIVVGFSSILTGLNFVVTVHTMRAPGMHWFRMPIFVWTMYATSLIFLLATPVITMALILLVLERAFGIGVFDPALGGDPVLFEHLFWFYSHPAVYIMVLPGMGVISEIIPAFSQKKIFGYRFICYATIGSGLDHLLRLGTPHVRQRAEPVREPDLLVPVVRRRRTVSGQSLQLDGDDPQRCTEARHADALRDGLHRAVRARRFDGPVLGDARHRRARA